MTRPLIALLATAALAASVMRPAAAQELWLAPPATGDHADPDLSEFVTRPEEWSVAASRAKVFAVPAHYLTNPPANAVSALLDEVKRLRLKLNVTVLALPADKSTCDGEGVVWPGEARQAAQRLKARGAEVDSFTFDLPLTEGVLSEKPRACRLSVAEAAKRLAQTVRDLRVFYPSAKMYDAEVPTGMPVARWSSILAEWLADYRAETDSELAGLTMDVWYEGDWQSAADATAAVARKRGISVGAFIDASAGSRLDAAEWVAQAEDVRCRYAARNIALDYIIVANWLDPKVRNLPESDSSTLTGLFDEVSRPDGCDRRQTRGAG